MEKSVNAFRTISEAAVELDVPQHVLRFWETKFKQIKPLKRGGGRRFYRPQDINLIKGIKYFLYGQGYTIKGVQKILSKKGVVYTANVWRELTVEPVTVSSSAALMGIDLAGADVDIKPTNPSPSDFVNAANPISYVSSSTDENSNLQERSVLEKNTKIKTILAELSELKQMIKTAE
ncbi:MAG: MerR family transcriptional regulator [Hyphomicrobiales bacterium]|nr:MerR family transcriptional regulator [Hyphomicrobiales bacterium]